MDSLDDKIEQWKKTGLLNDLLEYKQECELVSILEIASAYILENKISINEAYVPLLVQLYKKNGDVDFMDLLIDVQNLQKQNLTPEQIIIEINKKY